MSIHRVAIVYDDHARPETTGVYCRRALGRLAETQHFGPADLYQVPRDGFDLYLNIDDGLRYHLPRELWPCAWWAIDTHLNLEWCLQKARGFDCVFAAQRDGAELLRKAGIESAAWLPLACDPAFHHKHDVAKPYDVAFVGNIFPGPREDLLAPIRWKYPKSFLGRRYFDEMAHTCSEARTVFNRSIKNDTHLWRALKPALAGSSGPLKPAGAAWRSFHETSSCACARPGCCATCGGSARPGRDTKACWRVRVPRSGSLQASIAASWGSRHT
jgi:DUF based on E. rectale Gene description (DUF3880)